MPPDSPPARWPLRGLVGTAAVLLVLAACIVALRDHIPANWIRRVKLMAYGIVVEPQSLMTRDGVALAGDLYRPTRINEPLPTILIRLPYGRSVYGEALGAAAYFAKNGYAVLVQDVRGKYGSGGTFTPWQHATEDGSDTLDWLVRQPWSNGKVGTWGCSALGELQYSLARARHPAHAAMVPIGAGGGAGSVGGRYGYFGVYEGGVLQLASAFGWLLRHGELDPAAPALDGAIDYAAALQTLPISQMVSRLRPSPNAWDQFTLHPLTDPNWKTMGYVMADDALSTPALDINTWGDQTLDGTLALAEQARRTSPQTPHHVVIAPGDHCQHDVDTGKFGDIPVRHGAYPFYETYLAWFDHWLRGKGPGPDLPPYLYYMLGEDQWLRADQWPPQEATTQRWYLASGGHANGGQGDGRLQREPAAVDGADSYRHDPVDPVPTRGGPICCTGRADERSGPIDQTDVERRQDVLVYTSDPLARPLRIAGPLSARLVVQTSAEDTDFIARLVDVAPDGRTLGLQEGAFRLRYREGFDDPKPAKPGDRYEIDVQMRSFAYRVPAGHRLRLHVASSSFPRLERHLGSAGANLEATQFVVAENRVHHGPASLSYLSVPVLPDAGRR